jgi:hypothetical protein
MFEKTREGGFGIDVRRKNHEGRVVEIVGKKGKRAGRREGKEKKMEMEAIAMQGKRGMD